MTNYDQRGVKITNRKNVIEYISSKGCVLRKDICDELGSSLTTVLEITDYLEKKGIIRFSTAVKTERGRYPKSIEYIPEGMTSIAISYDGSYARAALCDSYGNIIKFHEADASLDPATFFREELPAICKKLSSKKYNILGVGLCMPGDFSPNGEVVALSPFSKIADSTELVNIHKAFTKKVNMPLYFFNDGNASAYGEYLARGKAEDNLVFIHAGEGFGAGLILDGKLRFGKNCTAGEVGYFVFDPNFTSTLSKSGWFENQLSGEIINRIENKEEQIEYVGDSISLAIANICNILDIDLIVLGGKITKNLGDSLLDYIRTKTGSLCFNSVKIESPLLEYPDLSGSAALVIARELKHFIED